MEFKHFGVLFMFVLWVCSLVIPLSVPGLTPDPTPATPALVVNATNTTVKSEPIVVEESLVLGGEAPQTYCKLGQEKINNVCEDCPVGKRGLQTLSITIKPALDEYVYTTRHEAGAACAQMGYGLCSKADVMTAYTEGICNAGFTSDGAGYVTGKCASDTSVGVWDDWTKYKGQKMTAWCCDSGIMYLNEGPLDHGYYSDEAAATDACKIKGETNGARYDLCERQAVLDRFPEGYCHFGYTNDNQVGFPSEEKEGCGGNTPKGEWDGWSGGAAGAWCCRTPGASINAYTRYCDECPNGRYNSKAGSAMCEQCPTGKYQIKKTKCEQCEAGLYTDVEGLSLCKSCPNGRYNSKAGSANCDECPATQHTMQDDFEIGGPTTVKDTGERTAAIDAGFIKKDAKARDFPFCDLNCRIWAGSNVYGAPVAVSASDVLYSIRECCEPGYCSKDAGLTVSTIEKMLYPG